MFVPWTLCFSYSISSFTINLGLIFCYFQDKVGSWYSNPGTGTTGSGGVGGGGVGKYLKARAALPESAIVDAGSTESSVPKKRKMASAGEFKDFSAW